MKLRYTGTDRMFDVLAGKGNQATAWIGEDGRYEVKYARNECNRENVAHILHRADPVDLASQCSKAVKYYPAAIRF